MLRPYAISLTSTLTHLLLFTFSVSLPTATSPVPQYFFPYPTSSSRTAFSRTQPISGASFIGNSPSVQYPDPEPCKGNCSWIHDPSIIKNGDKYYRFSTSGNIAIATAPAIEGPWTYQGPLLTNGTSIVVNKARQDVWAPYVIKVGSIYYCYYAVSFIGSQDSQIGVATSTLLDSGTWTDHGSYKIPKSPNYNLIDAGVLQDGTNGPIYFTWGSFWEGIFMAKIDEKRLIDFTTDVSVTVANGTNTTTPTFITTNSTASQDNSTDASTLATSLPAMQNIAQNSSTVAEVIEGATLYKSPSNQKYYLFFSAGNCCAVPPNLPPMGAEYKTLVCRSDSIQGPYIDKEGRVCLGTNRSWGGTVVLGSHGDVYAPGGQGVIDDGGRTILYYHYSKSRNGQTLSRSFGAGANE